MSGMILSASLFNGQPVKEFVCFNQTEIDASKIKNGDGTMPDAVEPRAAYFDLLPVTGFMDAEYTKMRGQDTHNLKLRPKDQGEDGPAIRFDAMEVSFSNEREIKAGAWMVLQVCKGWYDIPLDDGTELEFTTKNLEMLASMPSIAKPIIEKAYELGQIKDAAVSGNLQTS